MFYLLKGRKKTRILIDPTGKADKSGLILAKESINSLEKEAHLKKFRRMPLSEFKE